MPVFTRNNNSINSNICLYAARTTGCAVMLLIAACAQAQTWPAKPIRIVSPNPAGGTSDILIRMIGVKLTESWGQSVISDARPGYALFPERETRLIVRIRTNRFFGERLRGREGRRVVDHRRGDRARRLISGPN